MFTSKFSCDNVLYIELARKLIEQGQDLSNFDEVTFDYSLSVRTVESYRNLRTLDYMDKFWVQW